MSSNLVRLVAPKTVVKASQSSIAARKRSWSSDLTPEKLKELKSALKGVSDVFGVTSLPDSGSPWSQDTAGSAVAEYKSLQDAQIAIAARMETIKKAASQAITDQFEEDGLEYPESEKGQVTSDTATHSFFRQGGDFADPDIDQEKLAEILGEDSDQVFVERVVVELDEDSLVSYLQNHPELIEKVSEAFLPPKRKPTRMVFSEKKS